MGLSLFGSKMKCGQRKKRLKIWVVGSSVFLFHSNRFKKTKKKIYEYRFRFFFNPKTLGLVKFRCLTQKKKKKKTKKYRPERGGRRGSGFRLSERSHAWWWSRMELGEGLGLYAAFVLILYLNDQTILILFP